MAAMRSDAAAPARSPLAPTLLLLAAALAASPGLAQAPPAAQEDARAHQIAGQVMNALGGRQAWDAAHYVRFTFAGRRTHLWDKYTGRHRVEGQTKEGKNYVAIEDLNTKEGRAWLDGRELVGDELKEMLQNAYGAWVNDTYWLLMPYKLEDPGVRLSYAGEETIDGRAYDKLHLAFDHVGLTPGDEYWAYINKDTHLMDRWAFHLESMKADEPPSPWDWQGWEKYGRILLAPHRVQVGGDRKLELSGIAVTDTAPEAAFTSPAPLAAP
jgi:uncharacterized protein DUF6503